MVQPVHVSRVVVIIVFHQEKQINQPPCLKGGWRLRTIHAEIVCLILYIRRPSNHSRRNLSSKMDAA